MDNDTNLKQNINGFVEDTNIWYSVDYYAGFYKKINELVKCGKPFDTDSFNSKKKCFICSNATANKIGQCERLIKVKYGDSCNVFDVELKCTPNQEFLVSIKNDERTSIDNDYPFKRVKAKDLKHGMKFVTEYRSLFVYSVEEIEVDKNVDIYNISINNSDTYAINDGIIVCI